MSDKVTLGEMYMGIAAALFGSPDVKWAKPWRHLFHTVEMAPGARIVVEEAADEELHEVPLEHVVNQIIPWVNNQPAPEIILTPRQGKEAAQTWMAVAQPIPLADIRPVSWLSDPGYTWRRLPWDKTHTTAPTWERLLARMTNAPAFRQWLGSLLSPDALQHQYVWVHGMGNDGKGAINRFLARVFGRSYRSKQPPGRDDRFWTYGLIGSRLVVFPDCNSQTFTTGSLFKSLSGGDPVDVEAKGRMSFTTTLQSKFLFFSNERPNITCENADMRRIIYCEFNEQSRDEDHDPLFEDRLWAEGGAFISQCVREYAAYCPAHQTIKTDKEEIEMWVTVGEEDFQNVFDQHFAIPNELYRQSRGLTGLTAEQVNLVTLEPRHLLAIVNEAFTDQKMRARFRDWLYKKHGMRKVVVRRGDAVTKRYVGVHHLSTLEAAGKLSRKLSLLKVSAATVATVDKATTRDD